MKSYFFYALAFIILVLNKPDLIESFHLGKQKLFIVIYFIVILLHFLNNKVKNLARVDFVFLLSFTIVNLQWPLMIIFDFELSKLTHYLLDYNAMNYSTWLSVLGGLSWVFGFTFFNKNKKLNHNNEIIYLFKTDSVKWLTIGFFILFLLTAGEDFFSGSVYKLGGSGKQYGAGISAYFQEFFSIAILVFTGLVFLNYKKRESFISYLTNRHKSYIILIIVYSIIFLIVGDRGGFIQISLACIFAYTYFIKKIKSYKLIILFSIGAFLMTIIGLGRGDGSVFADGYKSVNKDAGLFVYSLNLANSSRVTNAAVRYIDNNDFFYGKLMLGNVLGAVPFSQSLYLKATNGKKHELSSSAFFTHLKYGRNAPSGEGTTLIADIFINFGSLGVCVFMLLLGGIFRWVNTELIKHNNLYYTIIALIVASSAIYLARANLLFSLKAVVWSLIVMKFVYVKIYKLK